MEPDPEILVWFTETEVEIVKNALVKKAKNEKLTTVEDVMYREYEMKLQARELRRQVERRNRSDGGTL